MIRGGKWAERAQKKNITIRSGKWAKQSVGHARPDSCRACARHGSLEPGRAALHARAKVAQAVGTTRSMRAEPCLSGTFFFFF